LGDGQTSTEINPSHTYANAGTYSISLAVAGPSGSNTKTRTNYIEVKSTSTQPLIALSPTTIQVTTAPGANPPAPVLRISNSGGGTLNYNLDDNAIWLTPTRIFGSLLSGESHEVRLLISSSNLAIGTYSATITVSDPNANNSPQTASVILTVQQPTQGSTITLNPKTFQFAAVHGGSDPPSQTLSVSNTGSSGSTLNYSITDDAAWLAVSPTSGSVSANASQNILVSINIAGLAAGTHNATITVTDPNATNSPQSTTVKLTITTSTIMNDVGITALNIPTTVSLGNSIPIEVVIKNFGSADQGNFSISYRVNNSAAVTESFTDTLAAGASTTTRDLR
jgi:uncharacterized membrane protein